MSRLSDDELFEALGLEQEKPNTSVYTVREERIIAGFEEIQRFVEQTGRTPQHSEDKDIFERLYAVRLDRLREQEESCLLLKAFDKYGLLSKNEVDPLESTEVMTDEELFAALVSEELTSNITELRHVRSQVEKQAAEEIAKRDRCEDFDRFSVSVKKNPPMNSREDMRS